MRDGVFGCQMPRVCVFWLCAHVGAHLRYREAAGWRVRASTHAWAWKDALKERWGTRAQEQKRALPKVSRSVLATTIATAPAAWAMRAFFVKEHPPRLIYTMLPRTWSTFLIGAFASGG
jgi:hypothetical protein